jgi:hypothetical protein
MITIKHQVLAKFCGLRKRNNPQIAVMTDVDVLVETTYQCLSTLI